MQKNKLGLMLAFALLSVMGCERQPPERAPSATVPAAESLKPVATVKQIMLGITVPASNAVFAVAGAAPATDAAWQAVEASALAVAESGNLLLMKPRALDDARWRQYTLALIDAGVRAAAAAQARNAEQTGVAGDDMYNACEQCHAQFLPKPKS